MVWIQMIQQAKSEIELCHFYGSDEVGSRLGGVVRALEDAADRGVTIRMLFASTFQETYSELPARLGARPGIQVAFLDLEEETGGVMHAKYMLVDQRDAFLGSANLDWRSLDHIVELGVRVEGTQLAGALGTLFEGDWARAHGRPYLVPVSGMRRSFKAQLNRAQIEGEGEGELWITPAISPASFGHRTSEWDLPQFLELIDTAQVSLRATTLTLKLDDPRGEPFDQLRHSLTQAAKRGVQIQLLVSQWCKRGGALKSVQELNAIEGIEVRFLVIPEASTGPIPFARVLHAKTLVADGKRAWIGSSNLQLSYFTSSRNVGLIIEGEPIGKRLDGWFENLWNQPLCEPVTEKSQPAE
jgi:phosphatidylserine/phosphatidylglycerophosphate/cardiolipin synthase-like enzyme